MFQYPRPVEELYDTEADPHETHNLAADPQFTDDKARLRTALESWIDSVGDMGTIPELEMVRRWYPGGMQPQTAAPLFIPLAADQDGIEPAAAHYTHTVTGPAVLQLYCATQGASIAYRFETDTPGRWRLYTEPFRLQPGRVTVHTRACRIGYADSMERTGIFIVK
jgi:hypothetical protein